MTTLVLDASVVLKWFGAPERGSVGALGLRAAFQRREFDAVVPPLLFVEVLNVAGRRWAWPAADLRTLVVDLELLPWRVRVPPLTGIARWTGAGLTAYDAVYVALAEAERGQVVTDDQRMLRVAGDLATGW